MSMGSGALGSVMVMRYSHSGSPLEERYGPQIRQQILRRFRPHVLPDPAHARWFSDETRPAMKAMLDATRKQ